MKEDGRVARGWPIGTTWEETLQEEKAHYADVPDRAMSVLSRNSMNLHIRQNNGDAIKEMAFLESLPFFMSDSMSLNHYNA